MCDLFGLYKPCHRSMGFCTHPPGTRNPKGLQPIPEFCPRSIYYICLSLGLYLRAFEPSAPLGFLGCVLGCFSFCLEWRHAQPLHQGKLLLNSPFFVLASVLELFRLDYYNFLISGLPLSHLGLLTSVQTIAAKIFYLSPLKPCDPFCTSCLCLPVRSHSEHTLATKALLHRSSLFPHFLSRPCP